ncbi:unnamed protein product [Camellia sinensis]
MAWKGKEASEPEYHRHTRCPPSSATDSIPVLRVILGIYARAHARVHAHAYVCFRGLDHHHQVGKVKVAREVKVVKAVREVKVDKAATEVREVKVVREVKEVRAVVKAVGKEVREGVVAYMAALHKHGSPVQTVKHRVEKHKVETYMTGTSSSD